MYCHWRNTIGHCRKATARCTYIFPYNSVFKWHRTQMAESMLPFKTDAHILTEAVQSPNRKLTLLGLAKRILIRIRNGWRKLCVPRPTIGVRLLRNNIFTRLASAQIYFVHANFLWGDGGCSALLRPYYEEAIEGRRVMKSLNEIQSPKVSSPVKIFAKCAVWVRTGANEMNRALQIGHVAATRDTCLPPRLARGAPCRAEPPPAAARGNGKLISIFI